MENSRPDKIQEHEDWQPVSARDFMAHYYRTAQGKLLPDTKDAKGEVLAYINHGRWIAECPVCKDARLASSQFPYLICFNGDNDGQFYNVVFPPTKKAIETVLEKRFARHPFKDARTRNWLPGETVKKLQDENDAHPEMLKPEPPPVPEPPRAS